MSRRGFTLTELLVVMGMTSVVITVSVGMLHRIMHEQKSADRENIMHRLAERLSTRLRADVHSARNAQLVTSHDQVEQRLILRQPNAITVTYVARENVLERAVNQDDSPTHRDRFEFPDNYRLEFADGSPNIVSLTAFAIPKVYLMTADDESDSVAREKNVRRAVFHINTSVGRDHRFSTSKTQADGT